MPTTPKYALPYPALADTPDVPRDLEALATRLDATLDARLTRISRGAAGPITGGAPSVLAFVTEDIDDLGAWTVSFASRLTAPAAGWYDLGATVMYDQFANSDAFVALRLVNPAVTLPFSATGRFPTAALGWGATIGGPVHMAAGQYAEVQIGVWGAATFTVSQAAAWLVALK